MNVALFSRDVGLHTDAQQLIGNLSSTALVPVDVSAKSAPTLLDLAKQLQDAMLDVVENSICTTGADTMARLNRRDGTIGRAVAPFVFASVLQEGEGIDMAANPFTWYGKTPKHSALTTPQVWLDVQVFNDVDGSLYFNWDAHLERFADGLVHTMFQAFCNLLENLADEASGQRAFSARPVLNPPADQMVNRLNSAALKPDLEPQLMHEAILHQAQKTPKAKAIFDNATGQSFTFEEVVKLARSFATAIVTAEEADYGGGDGLKRKLPGHPVAVYMKKGWQQVFYSLGLCGSVKPRTGVLTAVWQFRTFVSMCRCLCLPVRVCDRLLKFSTDIPYFISSNRWWRSLPSCSRDARTCQFPPTSRQSGLSASCRTSMP